MANKSIKALRNLNKDELAVKIREAEKEIFEDRMKRATGQLENVNAIWKKRKDLARMKMLVTTGKSAAKA